MSQSKGNLSASQVAVDTYQAAYWKGYITRGEVQTALEPLSEVVKELVRSLHGDDGLERDKDGIPVAQVRPAFTGIMEIIAKLDAGISFLMDKGGYKPAEVQTWHDDQIAKFVAAQEEAKQKYAQAQAAAETPKVTLE